LLGAGGQGLLMSCQQVSKRTAPAGGDPKIFRFENGGGSRRDDNRIRQRWPRIEGRGGADNAVAADHRDLHRLPPRRTDHHCNGAAVRQVDLLYRRAGFGQNGFVGQFDGFEVRMQ
jgi:hypothetical protein